MGRQITRDQAVEIALRDAQSRAGAGARVDSVEQATFPNTALGAARSGEMSADMVTSGWTIRVAAGGRSLEYRANERQVRLVSPDGNHVVFPG